MRTVRSLFDRSSRVRASAAKRQRRRSARRQAELRPESLEPRLALAISVFEMPTFSETTTSTTGGMGGGIGIGLGVTTTTTVNPGWVTVVSNNADDIYLQQVATAPQNLLWANNSSFINEPGVLNPGSGEPYQAGGIANIDSYKTIYVTNGEARSDAGVVPNDYPMYSVRDRTVRFLLNDDVGFISNFREMSGQIRYTQADGVESTWTYTALSADGFAVDFSRFRVVSGPGYDGSLAPDGYLYPVAVRLQTEVFSGSQSSLEVEWSDRLTSVPECDATFLELGSFSFSRIQSPRDLQPSASRTMTFTLPNATGAGSLGMVPGSISGSIGGETFRATAQTGSGLTFSGGRDSSFAGSYDAATGVITVTYRGRILFDENGDADVLAEDPGPLTLSASYAVYTQDADPNVVTFFAGHNISREVSVDLLTPGSTINVDSPLRMGKLEFVTRASSSGGGIFGLEASSTSTDYLAGGDIDLRATNVNINAVVESRDRLNIGNPLGDGVPMSTVVPAAARQQATRQVTAIADIAGGKVLGLRVPPGFTGVGYDRVNPPVVTIDAPVAPAVARVSKINGRVTALTLVNGGTGYTVAPTVTIGAPDLPGGVQATATAIVADGVVTRLVIDQVGSGYSRAPAVTFSGPGTGAAATAAILGSIVEIELISSGDRYANPPSNPPTVTILGGNGRARATATVVDGEVTGITVIDGGDNYSVDGSTVRIALPPTIPNDPRRATAEPVFDASGTRITGFAITYAGEGYGIRPNVTIAPPTPRGPAVLAPAVVSGGSITSIAVSASGYGYTAPPAVWISPPARSTAGDQATAVATIDDEGRITGITITNGGSGYDPAVAPIVVYIAPPVPVADTETVTVSAAVSAAIYDIRLANDLDTPATERGALRVTQSGSLGRSAGALTQADSLFVQARQADVDIEGTVWASNQSYLMQSTKAAADLLPFRLATSSRQTGANVGIIRGGTVGITLANDGPTPADGAVAFNDIDLRTQIDSVRIRAATGTGGVAPSEPFPYELRVTEVDGIAIEAVAASSFPISLSAGRNMVFNAALATASDVNISAGSLFTLSAPVSTTKGRLGIVAQSLTLDSSLEVTDSPDDDSRDDITLVATSGSIGIESLVAAKNNVRLEQANRTGPEPYDYSNREPAAITDNSTVSRSITIGDAFTFSDLDVGIDITHTFVGDLSAVLIAPDGTSVRLFAGVGGSGNNFTNTIFDSEAATPIGSGVPPFTGRFRPQGSLAGLYGRDARGTWTLQVTDSAGGDVGSLTNFTLFFTSPQPVNGRIAGAGRIRADHLAIEAEGMVGNPDLAPTAATYFLRTAVDSVSGRAAVSAALDELDDVNVTDLRVGGMVSLRASGVDPVAGANAGRSALTARLADVSAIEVSTPAGSVDVEINSPKTILLGNAEALRRGTAVSMVAAGDVKVRSSGGATRGDIIALDAPVAGGNARVVRMATTRDLATAGNGQTMAGVVYAAGNPGVVASTLRGRGNLSAWFGAQSPLRVGDRVLVKDQASAWQNGVYAVTSMSATTWSSSTTWTLTRATDADTAAEFASNTFVRVAEPQAGASQVGTWQISADFVPLNGQTLSGATFAASPTRTGVVYAASPTLPVEPYATSPTRTGVTFAAAVTRTGVNYAAAATRTGVSYEASPTRTGFTFAANANSVSGISADGLSAGMSVFGRGIAAGTTIQSITTGVGPLRIVNAGRGYTVAPTVTIGAPDLAGGVQATAIATVAGGVITNLEITNPGSGYTREPAVTFTGPGTGAAATSQLSSSFTLSQNTTAKSSPGGATLSFAVPITVESTAGLTAGTSVFGPGIPVGTTIASIVNGTSFRLSQATTAASPAGGTTLSFAAPITVTSTAGLTAGMSVFGSDIPVGTTIASIVNGTSFTLSQAPTAASPAGGATLKFASPIAVANTLGLQRGMLVYGPGIAAGTTIANVLSGAFTLSQAPVAASPTGGATLSFAKPITVSSTAGLVGMLVYGAGIPVGTTVASIVDGTTLTLSQAPTAASATAGATLTFAAPIPVASTAGLAAGMAVFGPGIAEGTTIVAVDGTSLTLSQAPTAASPTGGATLEFAASITVPSTAGLGAGMLVFGPGIAAGTTIERIVSATAFLPSRAPTAASPVVGAELRFVGATAVRMATTTAGGLDDILLTGLAGTSDLRVGMLVVGAGIPADTVITAIRNGTTVVMSNGATAAGRARVSFVTPFATRSAATVAGQPTVTGLSTTGDLRPGMVVVGPGIPVGTTIASVVNRTTIALSTAATSSSSAAALKFLAATPTNFGLAPITVASREVTTNIGSDDVNDGVTFVVSTAAGTNSAAGSLGKMMLLRQQNDTLDSVNPEQKMDFRFSSQVLTPIRLVQQLPLITKPFTIDGNTSFNPPGSPGVARPRITVDGSTLAVSRDGNPLSPAVTVAVNGFEVSGAPAGTVLSNMTIAGFTRGAAVQVQGAAGVLVNGVNLGSTTGSVRLPNQYGLRVSSGSSEVTLSNSEVSASNAAGVRVEGNAKDVVLVGNTIGRNDRDNTVGVEFMSTGANRLGVEPVAPLTSIPAVTATRTSATTFTLPALFRSNVGALFVGLGVTGPRITPAGGVAGTAGATVQSFVTNPTTGVTTVTIAGGTITASGSVTFGHFKNLGDADLGQVDLPLPASISPNSLYLGQAIAGAGIAANARIVAIARMGATATVTLSAPITRTGLVSITFPGVNNGAPRNTVQNNLTGVLLGAGSTTVVNTSIINNSNDGLRITGGTNTIGRTDKTRSAFSNVIAGNGGFGIAIDASTAAGTGSTRASAVALANAQVIRGNFLGVTTGNQSARVNTKGNIGLRYKAGTAVREEVYRGLANVSLAATNVYNPNPASGVDAEGNQHSRTTTGGGSSGSGGAR
jgi:subtilisin-like proprotein convertase family protein